MIIGIGNDIIEIARIEESLQKYQDLFLKKIFLDSEIKKYESYSNEKRKISYLAKRFAAKEAFSKACGTGIGSFISFKDIEIVNNNANKPEIKLSQEKYNQLLKHFSVKILKFHLSLSDQENLASAFVIIENLS